jgi:hypothetical protein
MEIKASVEAGDMEYAVAERQADKYSAACGGTGS